ncbi:hypothetical protein SAMN05880590_12911, partial [Rhizobium sp. RU35A]
AHEGLIGTTADLSHNPGKFQLPVAQNRGARHASQLQPGGELDDRREHRVGQVAIPSCRRLPKENGPRPGRHNHRHGESGGSARRRGGGPERNDQDRDRKACRPAGSSEHGHQAHPLIGAPEWRCSKPSLHCPQVVQPSPGPPSGEPASTKEFNSAGTLQAGLRQLFGKRCVRPGKRLRQRVHQPKHEAESRCRLSR